jgi:hypothetical protein
VTRNDKPTNKKLRLIPDSDRGLYRYNRSIALGSSRITSSTFINLEAGGQRIYDMHISNLLLLSLFRFSLALEALSKYQEPSTFNKPDGLLPRAAHPGNSLSMHSKARFVPNKMLPTGLQRYKPICAADFPEIPDIYPFHLSREDYTDRLELCRKICSCRKVKKRPGLLLLDCGHSARLCGQYCTCDFSTTDIASKVAATTSVQPDLNLLAPKLER